MLKFENYKMVNGMKIISVDEDHVNEMKKYASIIFGVDCKNICLVDDTEISKIPDSIEYDVLEELCFSFGFGDEYYMIPEMIANIDHVSIMAYDYELPENLIKEIKENTDFKVYKTRENITYLVLDEERSTIKIDSKSFTSIIDLDDILANDNPDAISASKHLQILCTMRGR